MPSTITQPKLIQVRDALAVFFTFVFNVAGSAGPGFQLPGTGFAYQGDSLSVDYSLLQPSSKVGLPRSIAVFIEWITPYNLAPGSLWIATDCDLIAIQPHNDNADIAGTVEKSSFVRPINANSKRLQLFKQAEPAPSVTGQGTVFLYPYDQPSFTSW